MFGQSRLKIERANHHIFQLHEAINAFMKTDFYVLSVEFDAKELQHVASLQMTAAIPPEWPLIIGDAAHNLRASLDLMVCDIIRAGGKVPTKYTKFVTRQSRDELVSALNGGEIKALFPHVVSHIVDVIQPYSGGNGNPICLLHDLDIQDKHFLLTPVLSFVELVGVTLVDENGNAAIGGTIRVSDGGKLNVMGSGANIKIKDYGKPAFNVLFGDQQPFHGKPVIPTLHQLSQFVSGVVDSIERCIR